MYCCTHRVLPSCLHRFTEGCSRLLDCFLVCVCARARVLSCSVVSNSLWPYGLYPTKLHCPWDSTGKNTGVGCHFLLQFMKVKRESEVAQSCLTLSDPMDWSLPGSSTHGISQARVLEWVAIAFSGPNSRWHLLMTDGIYCWSEFWLHWDFLLGTFGFHTRLNSCRVYAVSTW